MRRCDVRRCALSQRPLRHGVHGVHSVHSGKTMTRLSAVHRLPSPLHYAEYTLAEALDELLALVLGAGAEPDPEPEVPLMDSSSCVYMPLRTR